MELHGDDVKCEKGCTIISAPFLKNSFDDKGYLEKMMGKKMVYKLQRIKNKADLLINERKKNHKDSKVIKV